MGSRRDAAYWSGGRQRYRDAYDDDCYRQGSLRREHHRDRRHRRRRSRSPSGGDDDDRKGMIDFRKGERIDGRFEIVRVAGQGTFGTVLECIDHKRDRRRVAVKAVRSVDRYLDAAGIEVEILQKIADADVHRTSLCVRLLSWFSTRHHHRQHMFLVFEYLGRDLYTFMKRNEHRGFAIAHVRSFARQLLQAIGFCHSIKLCHTDLKPENILLCSSDYTLEPDGTSMVRVPVSTDIRVIDFGGATFEHERHARTVATRQYRAPEVILGLPWSYPSDIWSLGCIFAELVTGDLLFNTHDDLEHLALMERVLGGPLPLSMAERALAPYRRSASTSRSSESGSRHSRRRHRRSSECDANELLSLSTGKLRWPDCASGQGSIDHVGAYPALEKIVGDAQLSDLIRKMLRYEPGERLTAHEALKHPFFRTADGQ
ncbi:Protein kinase domain-containing protein [Plasmodiophora brassicae]